MFVTRATGLTSARLSAPPPPGGDAAAALQADGVLPHQDPSPAVRRPLRPHGHALRRHHALGSTDLPGLTADANCWVAAWWRSSRSALTAAASFFGAFSARECFSVPSFWDPTPSVANSSVINLQKCSWVSGFPSTGAEDPLLLPSDHHTVVFCKKKFQTPINDV